VSANGDTFKILIKDQNIITLDEVGDHVPFRRGHKRLHVCTVYRWTKQGSRARDGSKVRLPTIQVGGTKCTSLEALQWFFDRLGEGPDG
jgi:hypothetical protein